MSDPLLSVCLITFNHNEFIEKAVDSVLIQEVNFPWELIIADDFSTDGTREILLEYKEKYPDFIKLILQERNIGAAKNWFDLINTPKGKYIAYFEGDDYWTDPHKLQKQVDFLEANEKYVGSFHNVEARYQDGGKKPFLYCNFREARDITFKDLSYANVMPTCAVVFRRKHLVKFPSWITTLPTGDWALHLFNAQYGSFRYMPQTMGVYRITNSSVWAMQSQERSIRYVIETYDKMIKGFSGEPILVQQLKKGRIRYVLHNKFFIFRIFFRILKKISKNNSTLLSLQKSYA